MGREGRALRMDVLLAPQIELSRALYFSRNKDQTGEDPHLNARLAVAQIEGVQAQGMLAMAKHYLANNQRNGELNRSDPDDPATNFDFRVDDRTLHEMYLPAWEAVVRAGVSSVMAAYNHLNGEWNTENRTTLTDILRGGLGFEGFVTSDWNSVHSISVEDGLDMQMPDGTYFGDPLEQAVQDGTIPESALDTTITRILGQYDRFGLLDGSRKSARAAIDVEAGARTAREVATQGAVLLANDGALPLGRAALRSLALIGPTAAQVAVSVSGERAYGFEDRMVSLLDALRRSGDTDPRHAVGVDLTGTTVPADVLTPDGGTGHGLTRTPAAGGAATIDPTVDFTGDQALPVGSSYVWTGTLTPPTTGEYRLMIQAWRGAASLSLDGSQLGSAASPRFGYGRLSVSEVRDGLEVSFTVANTGERRGAEVPQVYVGPPPHAPVDMPVRTLAAFERIELRPGQSRLLTLRVDERRLSYWDTGKGRWVLPAGRRTVEVSASAVADSRQTLLCTYLSAALLAGLVLNAALGWSWADPAAALVIAALAVKEGRDAWQGKGCCAPAAGATADGCGDCPPGCGC
ncbi:fibronectin type III-like domain-contianing protein [Streptomyces sp. ISL-12]|uniref:beta-glucosidase n=1 Tax=Streptomyces sp. ISL-12 TaxID=2819177 RepID=UPI001BE63D0C|nr:glycoside hydrolase family 3 N-terminal domain-containing protein [Streptomyces sp. ISL-12]MBT2412466.1 fibronectin type III-like domain-contianing protein [Streptomyces sp. ISL-12]